MNFLGRIAQLKSQESTRQAILNLQNKEEGMPKCPWCAGTIEEKVSKCRHCTSDIAWVNVNELLVCKPQDKDVLTQQELAKKQKRLKYANEQVRCSQCSRLTTRGEGKSKGGNFCCSLCFPKYQPPTETDWSRFGRMSLFWGVICAIFSFACFRVGHTLAGIFFLIAIIIVVWWTYEANTEPK